MEDRFEVGDIVKNLGSGETYVVLRVNPKIVAVRTILIDNPYEWHLLTSNRWQKEIVDVVQRNQKAFGDHTAGTDILSIIYTTLRTIARNYREGRQDHSE